MTVFILTLKDKKSESPKLVKNLGLFQKRSGAYSFIVKEHRIGNHLLAGGRFPFATLDEIIARENDLGYNPEITLIFENDFWAICAEKSVVY